MSLRKEMFIAIFLGLLLGGGAALLFAQIPRNIFSGNNTDNGQTTTTPPTPSPTPVSSQSLILEVVVPEQQAIVDQDEINVSGKTRPGATVAVTSAIDEIITTADEEGTFTAPITIILGANELLIMSIIGDEQAERTVVVNYTTDEL